MLVLSFAPWIAFSIAAHSTSLANAAFIAFGLALAANVPNLRRGRPKVLDVAGVAFFLVLAVAGLIDHDLEWPKRWAGVLGNGAIALIILFSIVIGVPFTLQYAREQAPPEVWQTPRFYAVCLLISWVWFAAMLVMTLGAALGHVWPEMPVWLHWAIPIAAFTAAIRFSKWYPEHVRRLAHPEEKPA